MDTAGRSSIDSLLKYHIIKNVYFERALSCADLSELVGKSIPLVTKVISELIESGYIIENGYAASTGGRRPLVYSLRSNEIFIVSVAMDQLYTRVTIFNGLNNPVLPTLAFELPLLDNKNAVEQLIQVINECILRAGIDRFKIFGVGIGMPGFVNAKLGINYSYLPTPDRGSLRDYLENALQLDVYVDNDSSLIALAESKFGLAKGRKDVMVINVGWGIGLGMIINGELFRGHNGYAGEFSHIPLSDNEETLCDCGKRGCLETEATLRVVANKAMELIRQGKITNLPLKNSAEEMYEVVLDAANKGDQMSIELFSDMGYKIGKGIAILIHINNPELIVLSGRGAAAGKILMAPIQQALIKYCIPRLSEYTEVKISKLGQDAYSIGVAALVMENFGSKVFHSEKQSV
jgi:predicted NBD/HSP70 family sugar kinase